MKKFIGGRLLRLAIAFVLTGINLMSFAQEKGLDVDINVKKESAWYQQPWAWVVGGAIFILLLVALMRGSGKRA
jgi:hypothetical protein